MFTKGSRIIEEITGKKLTFGSMVAAFRKCEEMTQVEFSEILGVSKQYLSALENGHKLVSVKQAQRFAKLLEYPEQFFIKKALQDMLDHHHLHYEVDLHHAA